MKLTATHEPPRNVGGLQRGALNGRMGGQIAGDGMRMCRPSLALPHSLNWRTPASRI
jgi:hypothetical protein